MRLLQGNTLVTLGGSLAFGVAAIFMARGWINDAVTSEFSSKRTEAPIVVQTTETTSVLVADIDLNFGDVLDAQSLRLVDMPIDVVPAGVFASYEELFTDDSYQTVVLTQMKVNEPVMATKISGPGARGSLSALIDDNMRAVTIRVNDVAGVGGFVLPGDHVDVLLTRSFEFNTAYPEVMTQTFLQNVRVLGVDQRAGQSSSHVSVASTVTLEVSLADAQRLTLAADVGRLSLTLRKAADLAIDPVVTVNQDSLNSLGVASYKPKSKGAPSGTYKAAAAPNSKTKIKQPIISGTAKVRVFRSGESSQHSVLRETGARPVPGDDSNELAGADTSQTQSKG